MRTSRITKPYPKKLCGLSVNNEHKLFVIWGKLQRGHTASSGLFAPTEFGKNKNHRANLDICFSMTKTKERVQCAYSCIITINDVFAANYEYKHN